jgi:hypothetical protein
MIAQRITSKFSNKLYGLLWEILYHHEDPVDAPTLSDAAQANLVVKRDA